METSDDFEMFLEQSNPTCSRLIDYKSEFRIFDAENQKEKQ